jgi:four helix bundle protein
MRVTRFEELEIWQLARELYKLVFEITSVEPFVKDFRFRDQMRASSGSVSDNISEGSTIYLTTRISFPEKQQTL